MFFGAVSYAVAFFSVKTQPVQKGKKELKAVFIEMKKPLSVFIFGERFFCKNNKRSRIKQ